MQLAAKIWTRVRRGGATSVVFGALAVIWLALYFGAGPVYTHASSGRYRKILARGDGHYMYLNTLSLALDGDLDLTDEYKRFGDPFGLGSKRERTSTGREWIFPIGTSVLQTPPFWFAHGLSKVVNLFGARIRSHGYTWWHQRITFLAPLLAGFFALVLGFRLAHRYATRSAALYGVVVVGLGSGLLFYSVYRGSYSHAWAAFAVALTVEYWDRTRGTFSARRYAIMGAYVGLASLTRMQEVAVAVLPIAETALAFGAHLRNKRYRRALHLVGLGLVAICCALLIVAPQLMAMKVFFGGYFELPQGDNFMRWNAPFLWEVLFSSRNGLFVWTPLLYFATLGLVAGKADAKTLGLPLLALFLVQLWVNGSTWSWWGDASFSARRMLGVSVVWIAGVALAIDRLRQLYQRHPRFTRHAAVGVVLAPLIVMNMELSCAVSEREQHTGSVIDSGRLYGDSFSRLKNKFGNPVSWPYNLYWSIRHDIPISRFERLVGGELVRPHHRAYREPGTRVTDKIKLTKLGHHRYASFGDWFYGKRYGPRLLAWARPGARIFIPLFVTENMSLVVFGTPMPNHTKTQLYINGTKLAELVFTGGRAAIPLPESSLRPGTNELRIDCSAPSPQLFCTGIERLELTYASAAE